MERKPNPQTEKKSVLPEHFGNVISLVGQRPLPPAAGMPAAPNAIIMEADAKLMHGYKKGNAEMVALARKEMDFLAQQPSLAKTALIPEAPKAALFQKDIPETPWRSADLRDKKKSK